MDWSEIELVVYGNRARRGLFCLPEDGTLHRLRLEPEEDGFALEENPLKGRVEWTVRTSLRKGRVMPERVGFVGLGIMGKPMAATSWTRATSLAFITAPRASKGARRREGA